MRMGKYEMGRTLGEGHFGKVRLARHADTGRPFAIKILDRQRILAIKIDEQVRAPFCPIHGSIPGLFRLACSLVAAVVQIKTEIATLKLLKHPNVVRLPWPPKAQWVGYYSGGWVGVNERQSRDRHIDSQAVTLCAIEVAV
ncbi:CBL-interacting protein kinase 21 [Hordeum vulgare]|nr:CBL-interacting protein kinase 21 [Hordeum vulgare]